MVTRAQLFAYLALVGVSSAVTWQLTDRAEDERRRAERVERVIVEQRDRIRLLEGRPRAIRTVVRYRNAEPIKRAARPVLASPVAIGQRPSVSAQGPRKSKPSLPVDRPVFEAQPDTLTVAVPTPVPVPTVIPASIPVVDNPGPVRTILCEVRALLPIPCN